MDHFAYFLQAVGYRSVVGFPYLTVYLHLLVSALFPIYAGAHASLSRPSSAKKPKRSKKRGHSDDESEEEEQSMEGLSPVDALLLPLFAGLTLASLYFLIKWLEDPELLNKILNWYFAVFGVWSLARMITDAMVIFTSFVFPDTFDRDGNVYEMDAKQRKSNLTSSISMERSAPVPKITKAMWTLREIPSQQLEVRIYVHRIAQIQFKIGPQGISSLFLAIAALLYFNLIGKPWWLTNLLGFGFAYSALQVMSPTTSWTGTLILGALFIYDIYFVFFTPLMVTVATQLDIPAKLLFPRPSRPNEDPTVQALSMLGLGDIIVPGMMIGFALRFDLYLFYLRKQTQRTTRDIGASTEDATNGPESDTADDSDVIKATWHPATGGWGERFWNSKNDLLRSKRYQGVIFPKTYFRASIIGYFLAMLCTLGVMDIYGKAQPALLYLVPGVLGSLWGTALIKGDIKTLWAFDEFENDQERTSSNNGETQDSAWKKNSWLKADWKSLFSYPTTLKGSANTREPVENSDASDPVGKGYSKRAKRSVLERIDLEKTKRPRSSHGESSRSESSDDEASDDSRKEHKAKGAFERDRRSELIFISVNLPKAAAATSSKTASVLEQVDMSAHVADRTRAKTEVEENKDDALGDTR